MVVGKSMLAGVMVQHFQDCEYPEGSKDPNNRAVGPKYHQCYSIWA